jgi:YVTN family beta-propeller protein
VIFPFLVFLSLWSAALSAQPPVRSVTDPGVVTTRQSITPAGVPVVFHGKVYGVDFGATDAEVWVLTNAEAYRLDWRRNRVLDQFPLEGTGGIRGLRAGERTLITLARGGAKDRRVHLAEVKEGQLRLLAADLGQHIAGAPALAAGRIAVPLVFNNQVAIVDAASGKRMHSVPAGIAPVAVALSADGKTAWAVNWGGRLPRNGDLTATTGMAPGADRVVVDARGVAATGSVSRIDADSGRVTHTIAAGLHPTALALDEKRGRLYVANTNEDSVSVISLAENRAVATLRIQPFARAVTGIAPTALALSPDGAQLYVTCGGINAVAVIDAGALRVRGLIPTAWYPNAIAVSADGKRLAVASLLGAGSGWRDEPKKRFVHAYRGAVAVVDTPDKPQLDSYTAAVAENNHLALGSARAPAAPPNPRAKPVAIPQRAGEPSLIEHVVYIIKENRTYDQLFGDLEQGNGDPSLVMFGEKVSPNHRKLARDFVLLDNFYATGGNSANGHQWATQANETSYTLYPGYAGRSYPYDGSDPIAYSSGGFLWDLAAERKKSVRIFGEFVPHLTERGASRAGYLARWRRGESFARDFQVKPAVAGMEPLVAKNYPSYTNGIPDVVRASIFLEYLREWEAAGTMPHLSILQLPCDHTLGASPGMSTPSAMVADNDLALGQIVEALSKSRFWPKMAIFVVEDDAQNGVDHVDGHRTIALAISPYARRGHVDSTFYSQQSMLKTIELILGLPTLSLFDLIATDMRASFQNEPDLTPYRAVTPEQSLDELNPPLKSLRGEARRAARDSQRMRWEVPDAAPTERLNRILWGMIRGWHVPYPGARNAVFAPLSLDLDDDERE